MNLTSSSLKIPGNAHHVTFCFTFRQIGGLIYKSFTLRSDLRHLVIGHSQIKDCWDYKYQEPELDFKIDWICMPGGKAQELKKLLISEIKKAQIPLRISAVIWQNSITTITLSRVKEIIEEIESTLKLHLQHRVALPECQYVPEQADYFEHIAKINLLLADFNQRHGFKRYPLFRSTMTERKRGSFHVKQNRWLEYQTKTGPGFHIADKTIYTKFIRKFHLNNLENSIEIDWKPSIIDITKDLAVLPPSNKMDNHFENKRDLRKIESNRKRSKPTVENNQESEDIPSYAKQPRMSKSPNVYNVQNISITFDNVATCPENSISNILENIQEKQTVQKEKQLDNKLKASNSNDNKKKYDMENWSKWADLGDEKGYFKPIFKLINIRVEKAKEKLFKKLKKENKKRMYIKQTASIDKKVEEANKRLIKRLKTKIKKREYMKQTTSSSLSSDKDSSSDSSDLTTTSSSSSYEESSSSESSDE